jgi:surfactin synthase thioesterase subunit
MGTVARIPLYKPRPSGSENQPCRPQIHHTKPDALPGESMTPVLALEVLLKIKQNKELFPHLHLAKSPSAPLK